MRISEIEQLVLSAEDRLFIAEIAIDDHARVLRDVLSKLEFYEEQIQYLYDARYSRSLSLNMQEIGRRDPEF